MMKQKRIFAVGLFVVCLTWPVLVYGTSLDEVTTRMIETEKKLSETKQREKSVLGSLL